jgi:serine/threonine protein kinase
MVWGTPGYLAPEALKGEGQTEKGDLFALGVILQECLNGANPFEGQDVDEMVRRSLEEEVPPLRSSRGDVPAELEALVTALLQKEPERRPESAGHVADRLERLAVEREWRWSPTLDADQVFAELPSKTFSMMIRRGAGGTARGATVAPGATAGAGRAS